MPTDHATDQPTDHSLTEAARALGLTPEAVRSRVRRGTLDGERVNGSWRVRLPGDAPSPGRSRPTRDHPTDRPATDRLLDVEVMFAAQRAALDHAEQEITWLRGELSARSQELAAERERSDVLHREAFARIEALTAGSSRTRYNDQAPEHHDDPAEPAVETSKTPESPQVAQDGSRATEAENLNPGEQRGGFARWWERLFGR